jgi:CSLREA domain-containing protein
MVRSVVSKVMWVGRARSLITFAVTVMVALLMGVLLAAEAARSAATIFTVNSTGDAGDATPDGTCDSDSSTTGEQCTLRAAIQEANTTTDADTINFNIGGGTAGVKTINVGSSAAASGQPLPPITQPVTIDGYTQTGATPNTFVGVRQGTNANLLIELNGVNTGSSGSGLVINTEDVVVKGLVINRFGNGISISGSGAKDNRVEGNFIGTDPTGTTALGNGNGEGVSLFGDAGANIIGGQVAAAHNLISGNRRGIGISSNTGNKIQGNLIGTNKDGTNTPNHLGNVLQGVSIASSDNIVGSAAGNNDAEANLIAFNGDEGVLIFGGTSNRILNNSIHSNGKLGIDLVKDNISGVTKNDGRAKDRDTGANNLQNFPVISSATTSGDTTTIKGTLKSRPRQTFAIQIYDSSQKDPSGFGEGEEFFTREDVKTNRRGRASFTIMTGDLTGKFITATATSLVPAPNSPTTLIPTDTSEFSAAKQVIRK